MPNYNHAKYLELSLGAILAQSRPAQEILVIDDASTDDSLAIIEALAARNPSVRIIRNPKNAGVVSCMNFGVKVATGDYIYFAGADDEVRPGLFEQSLEVLEKHPTAALSCCDEAFFHEDTGESSERRLNIRGEPCYLTPAEVAEIKRHLRSTFIYGNTVIIRRAVLDEMKGFDPDLKWSCDDFAFNVAAFRYGLCY